MKEIRQHHNMVKASIWGIFTAFFISFSGFLVKFLSDVPVSVILFFRFSIGLLVVLLYMFYQTVQNKKISIKTKHIYHHIFRTIFALMAMFCFYYSLSYIPLENANLLLMTSALVVPIFGWILFRKKVSWAHVISIIIGFIGVGLVIKPGYMTMHVASVIALFSGVFAGVSLLFVRETIKEDNEITCLFYFLMIAVVISLFLAIINWKTPNLHDFILLMAIAIVGSFYQLFILKTSFYAPAKIVSSVLYFSILFSGLLGIFLLHEIPDIFTWIGMALITSGSVSTLLVANK